MLKNKFLLYCFFVISGIAAISCAKEPDLIGLNLFPADSLLNIDYTDTSSLVAYTVREEKLRTDELTMTLLGSIDDPVFGTTTASVYTQYGLSKNNISFGDNAVADSMILTLVYKGVYGDSLAPKTIRVFEMADTMSYDATYYSNTLKEVSPELIGEASFIPNLKEADSVNGNYMPPHMRVVLSQAFADKIISAGDSTLKNNENFQEVFKGLYITADQATAGTGSILYLNFSDALSGIKIYYHNDDDTTSIDFPIGSTSARYNYYDHNNYENADQSLLQQLADTTLNTPSNLYVQAMAGTKVKLRIPHLNALAGNKRIAVNEALLVFNVEDTSGSFKVPAQLALKKINIDGDYTSLPDEDEGSAFLDGKSRSDKEYRFRITRYVQDRLLNPDDPDYGLMLFAAGSSLTGNRVILKGPGSADGKIRLIVYYTIVD
ncbi:MAG: DUF4270 domain-containing protein [Bacteroidota bacterium]